MKRNIFIFYFLYYLWRMIPITNKAESYTYFFTLWFIFYISHYISNSLFSLVQIAWHWWSSITAKYYINNTFFYIFFLYSIIFTCCSSTISSTGGIFILFYFIFILLLYLISLHLFYFRGNFGNSFLLQLNYFFFWLP
jgi:hypothetical protein